MGEFNVRALKLALLSTAFVLGAASAASAADLGRGSYKDAPSAYMPAITWTGFYFGGNVGVSFDDNDDNNQGSDDDDTTWLAGVHVGYNWQKHGPWVFGIEGDVSFADDIDYLATIRGRLGYAMGSTLVYATGGAAFLGFEDDFSDDDTLTGWVAGLGIEHKLRENLSIGLEGLYYSFDDDDSIFGDEELDTWTVRARLSYHLTSGYAEPLK